MRVRCELGNRPGFFQSPEKSSRSTSFLAAALWAESPCPNTSPIRPTPGLLAFPRVPRRWRGHGSPVPQRSRCSAPPHLGMPRKHLTEPPRPPALVPAMASPEACPRLPHPAPPVGGTREERLPPSTFLLGGEWEWEWESVGIVGGQRWPWLGVWRGCPSSPRSWPAGPARLCPAGRHPEPLKPRDDGGRGPGQGES